MWAAIRYRRAQAVGLALLSALITACAVFAPLYESYLEQALLREGLTRYTLSDTAVTLTSVGLPGVTPEPARVRASFPASLRTIYDGGQEAWTGKVGYDGVAGASVLTVHAAQETCRGLRIVSGTCPSAPFQTLVSVEEARIQGWHLGDHAAAVEVTGGQATHPLPQPFTIVGTYEQAPDPAHWLGAVLTGKAGHTVGSADTPLMDDWVTTEPTFAAGWSVGRLEVSYLLDTRAITLDALPGIVPAVTAVSAAAQTQSPAVDVETRIGDLAAGVVEGQRQARLIVPLVMGQIGLLAVVVLGLVAASAVEQRRPELALVRLRGRGGAGAARVLLLELGTVVALGAPVGYAAAVGLGEVARRVWLTSGVAFRLPASTVVAALFALLLAIIAVAVVARPTVREPISTLLRRVPPRRQGWAVGVTDTIVIAVAVAGVASLVSGNISGPLVLATPTLLSLAVGLVLAHVLVPLAAALGRGFTRSGRVVGSLTTLQIARRPAVRRVMTIITVATAITVFATDAVVVGQRNRAERAAYEVGADQTMTTDATQISALVAALRQADPTGRHATPVVTVRQGDSSAITTFAVLPDQFAAVASLPRDREAFDWAAISGSPPPQASITGQRISVTLSDIAIKDTLPTDPDATGPPAPPTPLTVDVFLAPPGGGAPYSVGIGTLPLSATGPVTLSADVSCAQGCRLTGFGLETGLGAQALLSGKVTFGAVTADGGPAADLG
ncbi:MAG: FtsX-like permease family protein, partial [Lapillicoccus sp.]